MSMPPGAHYDSPTEGCWDTMRHILGEDLNVGCVLSWGPCWYTQKQYFEGKTSALAAELIRCAMTSKSAAFRHRTAATCACSA